MLWRLLLGGGRAAATTATTTRAAPLSTRAAAAAAVAARPAPVVPTVALPPAPGVGEYLRPHLDVLKALRKLLPQAVATQPQPAQPTRGGGDVLTPFECMNRNARRGKKANHGKRAVSSARRKQKRREFGKK